MRFDEIQSELEKWDTQFVNHLILELMKKGKVNFTDLSKQYVAYLEFERVDQRDLTAELAVSLVQHRNPKLVGGKTEKERKEFMDNKALTALRRTRLFPETAKL